MEEQGCAVVEARVYDQGSGYCVTVQTWDGEYDVVFQRGRPPEIRALKKAEG